MKAPKPGETVALRRGQNGQPAGLHLVHEVREDGRLDVTSWRTLERFPVPIEDIIGWDGQPPTLDARRPPKVEPPAQVEEPAPRLVPIHVINRRFPVEFVSRVRDRTTVHIDVGLEVGVTEGGQPIFAFDVPADLVTEFLACVDHAFMPGGDGASIFGPAPWTGGR